LGVSPPAKANPGGVTQEVSPPAKTLNDAGDPTRIDGIWEEATRKHKKVAHSSVHKDRIPVCTAAFADGTFFNAKVVRFANGPPEVQSFDYMDPERALSMRHEPTDWLCSTRDKCSSPEHKTEKKMWKRSQMQNKPKEREKHSAIEKEAHRARLTNEMVMDAEIDDKISWPILWTETSAMLFGPRACRHEGDFIYETSKI
jgi:hypothetical protein